MPISKREIKPVSVVMGALLTVGMRWTDRLIGVVSTLILARLLLPEDFGIVAMASIIVGLPSSTVKRVRAVSSLKCNTGLQAHDFASEDLGRGFESEAFSRAVV